MLNAGHHQNQCRPLLAYLPTLPTAMSVWIVSDITAVLPGYLMYADMLHGACEVAFGGVFHSSVQSLLQRSKWSDSICFITYR